MASSSPNTHPPPPQPPQPPPPLAPQLFSIVPLPPLSNIHLHHPTPPPSSSLHSFNHHRINSAATPPNIPYSSSSSSSSSDDEEDDDDEYHRIIQVDPTGRFQCWDICLGKGAFKEVYKAFDVEEGIEVAWNQLRTEIISRKDISKVASEVKLLKQLRHDNIINFTDVWTDRGIDGRERVYFITELMSSGTLKSFIKKTKGKLKPKVVKNLCRHILNGLVYLHSRKPPIIHRDLKCDNIFINGNNGIAKIGDLGLATIKNKDHISSVLGTPEFMAPELYDEKYDERVDIYAFGMCVLELVTKEYPYQECSNQAQIWKRVSAGIRPHVLTKISDLDTREFIELCITHDYHLRPSAHQLLNHPFLVVERPGTPARVSSIPPTPRDQYSFALSPSLSPPSSSPPQLLYHNQYPTSQQQNLGNHHVHFNDTATPLHLSSSPPTPVILLGSRKPTSQSSILLAPLSKPISILRQSSQHNHLEPLSMSLNEQLRHELNAPNTPEGIFRTMPPTGSNRASFQLTMQVIDLNIAQFTLTVKMAMWTGLVPSESESAIPGGIDNGTKHEVRFPFHLVHDTVQDIVDEMLREGVVELTGMERSDVANMMRAVVYGDEVSELVLGQADQVARDQLARMDALDWQGEHRDYSSASNQMQNAPESQVKKSALAAENLPPAEEIMDPKMFEAWLETMQQERRVLDLYEAAHGASSSVNSSPSCHDRDISLLEDNPNLIDKDGSNLDQCSGPSWAVNYFLQDQDRCLSPSPPCSHHHHSQQGSTEEPIQSNQNSSSGTATSPCVTPPSPPNLPSPHNNNNNNNNAVHVSDEADSPCQQSITRSNLPLSPPIIHKRNPPTAIHELDEDSDNPMPISLSSSLESTTSVASESIGPSCRTLPACPGDGAYISQFRRPHGSTIAHPPHLGVGLSPIKTCTFSSPSTSSTPTPTSSLPSIRAGFPPPPLMARNPINSNSSSSAVIMNSVAAHQQHSSPSNQPIIPPLESAGAAVSMITPMVPISTPIIATEPTLLRTLSELQSLALSGFAEDTMGRPHSTAPMSLGGSNHVHLASGSSGTTPSSLNSSRPGYQVVAPCAGPGGDYVHHHHHMSTAHSSSESDVKSYGGGGGAGGSSMHRNYGMAVTSSDPPIGASVTCNNIPIGRAWTS